MLQPMTYNKVREIFTDWISLSTLCKGGDVILHIYEKLPADFLIAFYNEILKNIKKGILTKNMYYELGLIISVASQRGIIIEKPCDFEQIIDQDDLDRFIHFTYKDNDEMDDSVSANYKFSSH